MTRAHLEPVEPDRVAAERLLARARASLEGAQLEGLNAEDGYGLCYQAALKAMIATLGAGGARVGSGAGGNVVLVDETGRRLSLGRDVTDRLHRMRRTRHEVFYGADEVSAVELEAALHDATSLVQAAAEAVARS